MHATSTSTEAVLSALAAIAGSEHLREAGDAVAVAPATEDEIAAILRFANEHQLPVSPRGSGTKQGWGNRIAPVILINTTRMQSLKEHTWQDMTCTVEAGCTWAVLQKALAQHKQFVALDPLWPERATVGGIVATNDSGALRLHYGGLRDLVIGMTIVLADGTIARTGGKVVKNVAGYDLHKLMIGAWGTLGFVTSVNFRLHAIPQSTLSFSVAAPTATPLGEFMLRLLHGQMSTLSLQLRGHRDGFSLDIRLASLPEVLQSQADALDQMARAAGLTVVPAAEQVWEARQPLMEQAFACKGTMLPADIARFAEKVRALDGEFVVQATGIMVAGFPASSADGITALRTELETGGGSLMVLKQPVASQLSCWGKLPDSFPVMREVKRSFDPQQILNPGRFLGGI